MPVDTDKILRRGLYLQRYVTAAYNDTAEALAPIDKQIAALLAEFDADADDKAITALSRMRTANGDARALLMNLREAVAVQQAITIDGISHDAQELVEQEIKVVASAMSVSEPGSQGVATLPIAGLTAAAIVGAAYERYSTRLRAEIVQAAASRTMAKVVRGSRPLSFKDGLFWWRNNTLIRPNLDVIVNGTAANAAVHVYKSAGVEKVRHLATLDFRSCISCRVAEENSPYKLGFEPSIPVHPRCRCRKVPWIDDLDVERPFVKDFRSVKDIPMGERDGKIGTTRDTIKDFFDRMTDQQRREDMGKTRAELWKQGKITDIRQLVNELTLQPLRLDQLPPL